MTLLGWYHASAAVAAWGIIPPHPTVASVGVDACAKHLHQTPWVIQAPLSSGEDGRKQVLLKREDCIDYDKH